MTGQEALDRLLEGNRRFTSGDRRVGAQRPDLSKFVSSQGPIAAVLNRSGSRVSPEHIFDQGFGSLFVVRVAGNVPGASELGSLEHAVGHLHVPFLLVMGHQGCGAVKAAPAGGGEGALGQLVSRISPAVRPVLEQDEVAEAVEANV